MIEWAEQARTRQGLYRFIGTALRTPDEERLALLMAAQAVLDERDLDRYPFSMYWRRFGEALRSASSLEDLGVEYVRLFGIGMGGTPAPPVESEYRVPTRDGVVAEFIASLQREYRSMGLASVAGAEAPDHISTEFEVMSYLCGIEADAWESGQDDVAMNGMDVEEEFLRGHLAIWVPMFAGRTMDASPNELYRCLVDLTHAFVVHETDYARLLVDRGAAA
jgi:TorA maturation chaperone TorD